MAKGQQRSKREVRKPKQEKAPAQPASPFGSLAKAVANGNASRQKGKG